MSATIRAVQRTEDSGSGEMNGNIDATTAVSSQPTTGPFSTPPECTYRPKLLGKVGVNERVTAAILLAKEDGVVTLTDDRSLRIWLKRDTGLYWPSIHHFLPSIGSCLYYCEDTQRLFIGLSNGVICEYRVADDYNSVQPRRDLVAHGAGVVRVLFSPISEWILSIGKDKQFTWHCSETGKRIGSHLLPSWCTCICFDEPAKYAFIGDYAGTVTVLRIVQDKCDKVSQLSAHTGSITSLAWDQERQLLFSASNDRRIIMWDIGGKKGNAFELIVCRGHLSRICDLSYSSTKRRLFSAGDNGELLCWDMNVKRFTTPEWKTGNNCFYCQRPFFWNVKEMWNKKMVGLRQHHCRLCGSATCANCCPFKTRYPPMGYELEVRICEACNKLIQSDSGTTKQFDLSPMAINHNVKQMLQSFQLDQDQCRLMTVGSDRTIFIWDVTALVKL